MFPEQDGSVNAAGELSTEIVYCRIYLTSVSPAGL